MTQRDDYDERLDKVEALLALFQRDPLAKSAAGAFIAALEETLKEEEEVQKWLRNKTL